MRDFFEIALGVFVFMLLIVFACYVASLMPPPSPCRQFTDAPFEDIPLACYEYFDRLESF